MGSVNANNSIKDAIINRLLLENTRVLYDFMQEMSNLCTHLAEPITNEWKYEYDEKDGGKIGGYIGKGSLGGRNKILNKLKTAVEKHIDECYSSGRKTLLLQNPLSSYLKFYESVFGQVKEESEYIIISEMLNYFNILRYLTESEFKEKRHGGFDSLPYIFEDMCLSIKNMTDTKSCYLVYKKEGEPSQLISRSGYVVSESDTAVFLDGEEDKFSSLHIGAAEFDLLIKALDNKKTVIKDTIFEKITIEHKDSIVDGIISIKTTQASQQTSFCKGVSETKKKSDIVKEFLLFDFPFGESAHKDSKETKMDSEKEKRHFYVILEVGNKNDDALLKIAIRVLFLRNRLWEAVKKYYAGIINFRFYCNYVQPIDDKKENVQILHLTDLHLFDDDSWASGSDNLKSLCAHLRDVTKEKKIDLIAVTGDIVWASDDAATAQRKYKRVAKLLFEISKMLWGEENGKENKENKENKESILPHDWKRRILITTGNHDYAAMNDMRVQTESRKITTGLPARSTGGTMSKYTYFLEFLSYFLDAPTQKLLDSDLNEVREYDNLDLIVGGFNSCSQANALQNNKVSFDNEKLDLVLKRGNWDKSNKKHIALAHHYPAYFIDYFNDKYGLWKYEKYKSFDTELYILYIYELNKHLKGLGMTTTVASSIIRNLGKQYNYKGLRRNRFFEPEFGKLQFKLRFSMFKKAIKDNCEWKITESELYRDIEMLYDILKGEHRHPDEYTNQFLSEARSLFETTAKDNEMFQAAWKKIGHKDPTVIAGHTHKAEIGNNNYFTIIGHMFYNGKNNSTPIVFEIISFSSHGGIDWHVLCKGQEKCKKNKSPICGRVCMCTKRDWLNGGLTGQIEKILEYDWES